MNIKSKTALAALSLIASTTVFSQAPATTPDYTLSYNLGAVSDYRFRGIAQTAYAPAVQGGVDVAHKSGAYLGAWASNVKWVKDVNGASQGDYEVDLYGGYKAEIAQGLGYDVGVVTYQYPGNNSGAAGTSGAGAYTNANTTEFYGALTYKVLTLKYNQSLGDFLGNPNSNASRYWDLSANFDLGQGYTLTPHAGRQSIPNVTGNAADYTDYALTLAKDLGQGLLLSASAIATNADQVFYTDSYGDKKYLGKSTLVLGLKYSF
jgi:uncharacterized protein (TIGR02001 family)